jgi:hypothetical protein
MHKEGIALRVDQVTLPCLSMEGEDPAGRGLPTVTVAVCEALPPVPVQVSVKVVFAVKGPVDAVPLVGRLPLQPPEAAQLVALVELQVRVAEPPLATPVGLALRASVGADSTGKR